ncbi:PIG-L deacetylase family protein [Embleya sp. NPDC008237]|uniref:PIG-L deacetylase family protein n=1 Tax=Embleya sp. NPDC008237 TaxID=3363978 RepID=UPI0036EDFD8E
MTTEPMTEPTTAPIAEHITDAAPEHENAIQAPGTPEPAWAQWRGLDRLPRVTPRVVGGLVVVAAHPDDEILGAGGLLASVLDAGERVRVVVLTDGDASHPNGPIPPADLVARRIEESRRALAVLSPGGPVAEIVRLGLPDTAVAAHEAATIPALAELLAGYALCAAPWSGDLHADHEAAGRIAAGACAAAGVRLVEYPVWMWHWAEPADPRVPWERAVRIDLNPERVRRKQRAIGCFETQIAPLLPGLDDRVILPPEELAHFERSFEVLFR